MKPSNDREAITLIVQGLVDGGHTPRYVNDGEENVPTTTVADVVEAVTAVDVATAVFRNPNGTRGWVWFVQGNEPEEVAADYTVNLDPLLSSIVDPWWE
jgi:hypothetical protein